MSIVNKRIFLNLLRKNRLLTTKAQQIVSDEYNEVAEYPPIEDTSYKARKLKKIESWHEKVKNLGTMEEKLMELNMSRYYGHKCVMINDQKYPYNCLPFIQYCTRTDFKQSESLPESYKENDEKTGNFLKLIQSDIEDALQFEYSGYQKFFDRNGVSLNQQQKQRIATSGLVKQINRVLLNNLGADNDHLFELDVDVDARHEAFWFVGGIPPTAAVKKMREGMDWYKQYSDEPIDRPFQYIGKPYLTLRHQHPLKPLIEKTVESQDIKADEVSIPSFKYDPRSLGYNTEHRHGTTIPGFWPGNSKEFGLLSYQDRNYMLIRDNAKYGAQDMQESLNAQGIISSYAWLFAQACYQGFSTYNDMTYPLTTQTIVTDGQNWSFYTYQMNTTLVHSHNVDDNPRYNQCWGTKEMQLFEKIDDNGKLLGLNDAVLKNLIQFYINTPQQRDCVMKPYLGAKEKKIADIENHERREFLEKTYKYMVSNRPRARLMPEIYNWEKIYKVDHNTKPLQPKRRFFELGVNPYQRRLDEHTPVYIPRDLRARGPHDKKKWRPMFYP